MNSTPKKLIPVFFILLAASFLAFSLIDKDLNWLFEKFTSYHTYRPQEKIYVHFDKQTYVAGEDIWFKTYLVDATFHILDTTNKVVYVELLSPDKKLLQRHILYSPAGYAYGDFHLNEKLPEGNYVVQAYTSYMKNQEEGFFYLKIIKVFNPTSIKPIGQDNEGQDELDLQFFPEGGNLIANVENRVAFKAINSEEKSANVEGEILNEQYQVVAKFKTDHAGMGMFKLLPILGQKYLAFIQRKKGVFSTANLPKVQNGYLLRVTDAGKNIRVTAYTSDKNLSPEESYIYLTAQMRGVMCYIAHAELKGGNALTTLIPKDKFSTGIAQITLFDVAFRPRCERLLFVNRKNTLTVELKSDKIFYNKREKAEIDITVSKPDGTPLKGDFSMGVYDVGLTESEKYPSTVDNYLLLTSDLKGLIEEPGYYLKDTLAETRYHLDLLMMTHGWRRFQWETILQDTIPPLRYFYEEGIPLSGQILKKGYSRKPAPGSNVKIMTHEGSVLVAESDTNGVFYTDDLIYYDSTEVFIQPDNVKGRQTDLQLLVNPVSYVPHLSIPPFQLKSFDPVARLSPEHRNKLIQQYDYIQTYNAAKNSTLLREVEFKSTKIGEVNKPFKYYGTPEASIQMKDNPFGYSHVLQVIQGRVAGVTVEGFPPYMRATIRGTGTMTSGKTPLFVLDGMPLSSIDMLSMIPVEQIESIDILKGVSASAYGGRGASGVIAICTKHGSSNSIQTIGVHNLKYPGFYRAREFYSPKYDQHSNEGLISDMRTTLYWNPSIHLNEHGKAKVSFYTSDVLSTYEIALEGISNDGFPGTGKIAFSVTNDQ